MAGYRNWLTNARQIRTGAVTASGPDMYAAALTLDSIGDQFDSGESQSGTLANRLARVLEKEGQRDKARHMYALAAAAGGAEIEASRQAVAKLAAAPDAAAQEIAKGATDLQSARTVALNAVSPSAASANFILVFDSSNTPERVEFADGDSALNAAGPQLRQKEFPVKFPDVSSIKLIRRAKLTCAESKCSMELLPSETGSGTDKAASASAPGKP